MLLSLFGYFFSMITTLTAIVVLLTNFSNISTSGNGGHHLRPPLIDRTVTVDQAAHSQSSVAQETSPAKDVSAILSTAKADTKKSKHYKSKVIARQYNNYGYWNARGYASRGLFFR